MSVLILGASGLVGGNCMRFFKEQGEEVMGTHFSYPTPQTLYFNTLNLTDVRNEAVLKFKPDVIIHCGALTWVDYCEEHPEESFEKTVKSTANAHQLAQSLGSKLVFLSTDYVFDGEKGCYIESDKPNPLSVYGKHKLEAESIVRSAEQHLICRITNVYGNEVRGKNFIARLVEQLIKGEAAELKLPIDQYASPVNAYDVARAIHALLRDGYSGTFHLASTDYLNRVQLAERVTRYFGNEQVKISSVITSDLKQPAPRPLNGGMSAAKFNEIYPNFGWTNVDDYLKTLKEEKNI